MEQEVILLIKVKESTLINNCYFHWIKILQEIVLESLKEEKALLDKTNEIIKPTFATSKCLSAESMHIIAIRTSQSGPFRLKKHEKKNINDRLNTQVSQL